MKIRILLPILAVASLSLGGLVGLAAFAAPGAPVVSASPVEGDDAPVAAPAVAVDAGPATGIGTSPGPIAIPDPVDDPGAFGDVALDAARSGKLALLAILVLLALSRGAIWAAARWPAKLGWIGGAARPWIVGAAGFLATAATSLATLGRLDASALLGALAAAFALELKATPPAKVAPGSLGGGK